MDRPVYDPIDAGNSLTVAPWKPSAEQSALFEKPDNYGDKADR
jgi:hypothetical protein